MSIAYPEIFWESFHLSQQESGKPEEFPNQFFIISKQVSIMIAIIRLNGGN
jgi:hypothetical protein